MHLLLFLIYTNNYKQGLKSPVLRKKYMKGWYYALKMAYNYMNKVISILGSTGSIGTQAIEVARMHNIKNSCACRKQKLSNACYAM